MFAESVYPRVPSRPIIKTTNNKRLQNREPKTRDSGAIILIGPSGSGKGQMTNVLIQKGLVKLEEVLSMGETLRDLINKPEQLEQVYISKAISIFDKCNGSEIVNEAKKREKDVLSKLKIVNNFIAQSDWFKYCVDNGLLLPDRWTARIMERRLEKMTYLKNKLFIVDGYPRTETSVNSLMHTFEKLNLSVFGIVHLDISRPQMKARLEARRRHDDLNRDALDNRYEFYITQVVPAINKLKESVGAEKYHKIIANQPVFKNGELDKEASINAVAECMLKALKISRAV